MEVLIPLKNHFFAKKSSNSLLIKPEPLSLTRLFETCKQANSNVRSVILEKEELGD